MDRFESIDSGMAVQQTNQLFESIFPQPQALSFVARAAMANTSAVVEETQKKLLEATTNELDHWFPNPYAIPAAADNYVSGPDICGISVPGASKWVLAMALELSNEDEFSVVASVMDEHNQLGLPARHGYPVLGFDAESNKITLCNPLGCGEPKGKDGLSLDGVDDGTFSITLDQFKTNFANIEMCQVKSKK